MLARTRAPFCMRGKTLARLADLSHAMLHKRFGGRASVSHVDGGGCSGLEKTSEETNQYQNVAHSTLSVETIKLLLSSPLAPVPNHRDRELASLTLASSHLPFPMILVQGLPGINSYCPSLSPLYSIRPSRRAVPSLPSDHSVFLSHSLSAEHQRPSSKHGRQ